MDIQLLTRWFELSKQLESDGKTDTKLYKVSQDMISQRIHYSSHLLPEYT